MSQPVGPAAGKIFFQGFDADNLLLRLKIDDQSQRSGTEADDPLWIDWGAHFPSGQIGGGLGLRHGIGGSEAQDEYKQPC